jgi:hypothetical protein
MSLAASPAWDSADLGKDGTVCLIYGSGSCDYYLNVAAEHVPALAQALLRETKTGDASSEELAQVGDAGLVLRLLKMVVENPKFESQEHLAQFLNANGVAHERTTYTSYD